MQRLILYLKLCRFHQPVGIWLLFWPCAWGTSLVGDTPNPTAIAASHLLGLVYSTQVYHIALFFVGSVAMRSAGCIVNDLWDREIDAQVERTRIRPLASGEVSVKEALLLLVFLLCIALWVVCQLPLRVFWLALASLPMVAAYPLMKRLIGWPQAFLGLTFNFGVLMGWAALTPTWESNPFWLYLAGIFWTLGYDTLYALQDVADDEKIGVKSTARWLKGHENTGISAFFALMLACFSMAGFPATSLLILALPLILQVMQINPANSDQCGRQFRFHALYGALVWMVMITSS